MGIKNRIFLAIFLSLLALTLPFLCLAQEETYLRVGGDYQVSEIRRVGDSDFRIIFAAKEKSGKFDTLIFNTKHLHVGIVSGKTMRISADVKSIKDSEAEVAQLVIFVPSPEGLTPIWMLSSGVDPNIGAKSMDGYLKLHAPQSDYLIF